MTHDLEPTRSTARDGDSLRSLALVLAGRSYREAAVAQGLPPAVVARHLAEALKGLHAELS